MTYICKCLIAAFHLASPSFHIAAHHTPPFPQTNRRRKLLSSGQQLGVQRRPDSIISFLNSQKVKNDFILCKWGTIELQIKNLSCSD
ncbi:unnamed protein product [Cuscuta epithymum]|uniref:Uncharacterized protein n=1 Tax=Cuscuta epithymum TaxID=186058 RepID=A0AAV0FLZ2_9ASTE|nr:unnamed protein product [Cuscuta epithymum]